MEFSPMILKVLLKLIERAALLLSVFFFQYE